MTYPLSDSPKKFQDNDISALFLKNGLFFDFYILIGFFGVLMFASTDGNFPPMTSPGFFLSSDELDFSALNPVLN